MRQVSPSLTPNARAENASGSSASATAPMNEIAVKKQATRMHRGRLMDVLRENEEGNNRP
jgi:hypothetical protein